MPTKLETSFAEIQAEANSQAPRADVLTTSPRIQASFSAPAAVLTTVNLRTGVAYVDLRSPISYVAMMATDILLAPHLLKPVTDTISIDDNVSFRFDWGLTLVETATLTDAAAKAVGKALADSFNFADAIVVEWTPIRLFTETVSVSDSISIFGERYYTDAVSPTDVLVISTSKVLADVATVADSPVKSVDKSAADTCSIADAAVLATMKALAETLSIGDNVAVLNASIESSKLNHSVLGTYMLNH